MLLMSLWQSVGEYACSACSPFAQPSARYMRSEYDRFSGGRLTVAPLSTPPRSTSLREPYSQISSTRHTLWCKGHMSYHLRGSTAQGEGCSYLGGSTATPNTRTTFGCGEISVKMRASFEQRLITSGFRSCVNNIFTATGWLRYFPA
jgi:hypothetical protein